MIALPARVDRSHLLSMVTVIIPYVLPNEEGRSKGKLNLELQLLLCDLKHLHVIMESF